MGETEQGYTLYDSTSTNRFGVIAYDAQSREEWVARARCIEYGISYIAVFDEYSEAFAPVIARLAGTQCDCAAPSQRERTS